MIHAAAAVGRRASLRQTRRVSVPPASAQTPPTTSQSRSLRTSHLACRRRTSTEADSLDSWSAAAVVAVVASTYVIRLSSDSGRGVMAWNEACASPAQNYFFRALNSALQANHERQMVKMAKLLRSLESLVNEEETSLENQERQMEPREVKLEESVPKFNAISSDDDHMHITQDEIDSMHNSPQVVWEYIDKLKKGRVFAPEDVTRIASSAARMMLAEPTLIDLAGRDDLRTVSVVGDLHGHFHNGFTKVLDLVGRKGDRDGGSPWDGSGAVVFNGDFVDRGENSLEVVLALLLLKLAYPNNVYLNRGNHEDAVISSVYGFSEEIESRYGSCINGFKAVDQIWRRFVDVFASLPLAVKTANALIVHGGIPKVDFDLDELKAITSEMRHRVKTMVEADDEVTKLIQNLMWSDPKPSEGVSPNEDRGCGVKYGPDIIKSFLARHGLNHIIRSHEPIDDGYEQLELDKDGLSAVTVFSAMNYPGGTGFNSGAIVRLHSRGDVTFESYSPNDELDASSSTEKMSHTFKAFANIIALNRTALEKEFEYLADLRASRLQLKRAFMQYDDGLSICATSSRRRFRDTVLSLGGGVSPMDVFKQFRGREPNPDALLRHNGLA